jgi:hypothetical protein
MPSFQRLALLGLPLTATAAISIQPRANDEHVVLADCRDGNGHISSQMAYYPGYPLGSPQDVAQVATPNGQSALWAGATTVGLFTTTGVSFTAKLGPKAAEEAFAGTGDNGFGTFTCWQRYRAELYVYSGTTCSMVYDCDHEPGRSSGRRGVLRNVKDVEADEVTVRAVSQTPVPAPSSNSTANGTAQGTKSPQSDGGLSPGAIGAIAGSVVGAFALGLAIGGWLWFRRRSTAAKPPRAAPRAVRDAPRDNDDAKKSPASSGGYVVHELDAHWMPEMEAAPHRAELETPAAGGPIRGEQGR